MMFIALCLSLLSTASADNNGIEVSLEGGLMETSGSKWDLFSDGALITTGVRAGKRLAENTSVTLGWRHAAVGSTLVIGDEEIIYDDYGYEEPDGPYLGIVLDQYSLGAKHTWTVKPWFQPYVTGEAILSVGHFLMDDDPDKEGNSNEIRRGAVAPGGAATVGMDVLSFGKDARWRVALFVESGYQTGFALKFVDRTQKNDIPVGDLPLQGVVTRFGLSAQF